jgi:hypothetical protein
LNKGGILLLGAIGCTGNGSLTVSNTDLFPQQLPCGCNEAVFIWVKSIDGIIFPLLDLGFDAVNEGKFVSLNSMGA